MRVLSVFIVTLLFVQSYVCVAMVKQKKNTFFSQIDFIYRREGGLHDTQIGSFDYGHGLFSRLKDFCLADISKERCSSYKLKIGFLATRLAKYYEKSIQESIGYKLMINKMNTNIFKRIAIELARRDLLVCSCSCIPSVNNFVVKLQRLMKQLGEIQKKQEETAAVLTLLKKLSK